MAGTLGMNSGCIIILSITLKSIGRRIRRRPRKRWVEDIEEDIEIMRIRGWRKLCKEREEWKRITEKAKTNSGL
jgi:hypothetical protein